MAKRFNAFVVEDWGKLVMLWQKDMEKLGERQIGRAVDRSEEGEAQFLKRTAVNLIGRCLKLYPGFAAMVWQTSKSQPSWSRSGRRIHRGVEMHQ